MLTRVTNAVPLPLALPHRLKPETGQKKFAVFQVNESWGRSEGRFLNSYNEESYLCPPYNRPAF
jgi:hypothetical protein